MTARDAVLRSGLERHEAIRLLMLATGLDRAGVIELDELTERQRDRFDQMVRRRIDGEPLQYIEEVVPFGPIDVRVDTRVLIPRPETERMWELASRMTPPDIVVDLCTGSGALALAAKSTWQSADVYGTDLSSDALKVAAANGVHNGLEIRWCQGDVFDALPEGLAGTVGLITANPPYVAEADADSLSPEVRAFEPPMALFAGVDGMGVIRTIGAQASEWLAPGGEIWCEIGAGQGSAAVECFTGLEAEIVEDLSGRGRYVHGVKR